MDIHRCRFVPYNPQAINALAFSHPPSAELAGRGVPTLRLAIGRANGDIEIWNPLRGAWFQETVLRGGKDRSIEGLVWTLDPQDTAADGSKIPGKLRLFSIGYSTAVTEWDVEKGKPLRHSSGNYGEIWCLAAQPRWQPTQRGKDGKWLPPAEGEFTGQHLAAGCADGSIVIMSTADEDLKFLRLMRPTTKRARVLSVTFQNRNTIVAGYADSSIRLYDIRNGQQLRTMSLGKGPTGGTKELLVWSVKCLPDGTIVSGDSAGEIRFWDGKNYSLIQRLQGHLADTLDVAVSAKGDTVISGGADQRTVVYRKKEAEKKGDKKARWAEVMHRRYHTHDVKTFAVYETKDISFVVSGGPDASPVILPLREFGKEHHRKLSTLPQVPQLASSPSSRLVMSFWDREVSIWRLSRGPTSAPETPDSQRHRLVGKVLIQGEENITSAMLSSDGKILVVATASTVKAFSVRRRKGDEKGILRIQKLDIPSDLADEGARVVTVSPDSRWISVIRPNSNIYLARIKPASSPQEKPQVLPRLVQLNRAIRHNRHEKASHGTLGNYERAIRCVVFSDNSRVLAVGDLSGCIDSWSLESAEESTEKSALKRNRAAADSDDDDDSDDEDEQPIIEGERWQLTAAESPIPRLSSGVALLSFRPSNPAATKQLTNGTGKPNESLLMALTSEHQLMEFDAIEGKVSDWSRRNPKAFLPAEFQGVKDRAMGCLWDLNEERERLWLYGTSWLWMFDLNQDFPSSEELGAAADTQEAGGTPTKPQATPSKSSAAQQHKRKRDPFEDTTTENGRKKPNTGAGDRIPLAQSDVYAAPKMRKITGPDDSHSEWVSLDKERPRNPNDDEDDNNDHDDSYTSAQDAQLARLRRSALQDHNEETDPHTPRKKRLSIGLKHIVNSFADTPAPKKIADAGALVASSDLAKSQSGRRWWHTYKYRDIMGIVPLSSSSSSSSSSFSSLAEDDDESNHELADDDAGILEVAVVERPMWDVDLPGRYVRDYE